MTSDSREYIQLNDQRIKPDDLHDLLQGWKAEHRRDLPWRGTSDPYRLLMAEMMLIRTRADQVEPVYRKFISTYPTLDRAAKASREEIHDHLDVLGLTWRADRVYEALQTIQEDFEGNVPRSRENLLLLPGVSQYVAGAVRCFAWGYPESLIDANTVRISGRLFGLEIKPHSRETKQFKRLIEDLLDPENPRAHNYALLDLGAKICTNRNPDCGNCPLLSLCAYGQQRCVE